MRKKILVLTQKIDPHIQPVAEEIQRRDRQVIRFDFGDFPQHVQRAARCGPQGWSGTFQYEHEEHALDEIQSIWWRRPNAPQAPDEYDLPTRAFLNLENVRGFIGVMHQCRDERFWVSKRDRIQLAEFKPFQLQEAQRLGLDVPRTVAKIYCYPHKLESPANAGIFSCPQADSPAGLAVATVARPLHPYRTEV